MSKTACKDNSLIDNNKPKYGCKKCDVMVRKEKHACKPKKLKKLMR